MIYFIKFIIDYSCKDNIENAIRRFSFKRHISLDLKSSTTYIKESKYFLGLEGKRDLKITRLRTPFEVFFPKVIVSFPKDRGFELFKIRYSILSTIVFLVLLLSLLQSFYSFIIRREFDNDFVALLFVLLVFIGLTVAEIQITKLRIKKAINEYNRVT